MDSHGCQPTFADCSVLDAVTVGRRLSAAHLLFHTVVAELIGISASDYKCLRLIDRAERPISAGEFAARTRLSTGAVTGVIDRLEQAGLVSRVRDAHDRRRVLIEVPPDGAARLAAIFDSLRRSILAMEADFTADELRTVRTYLVRSVTILHRETERLSSVHSCGGRGR